MYIVAKEMKESKPYIEWFLRLLLSLFLVASSILKFLSPEHASTAVQSILPINNNSAVIVIYIVSSIELLVGIGFLLHKSIAVIASISSALLLINFTLFGIIVNDPSLSCGCFGSVYEEKFDVQFIIRNIVFLSLSFIVTGKLLNNKIGAKE